MESAYFKNLIIRKGYKRSEDGVKRPTKRAFL